MSRITKWKLEKTKVKVVFRLQFHATQIPQNGWERLFISFIPSETGKMTAKTSKANVRNGTCKWSDPIYETTRLLLDAKRKLYDDKLYKLVVGMGSSRSSILGEATINLSDYVDALKPSTVALPLQGTGFGTILHVTVQLLTSKTGFREFEQQREIGSSLNREDEIATANFSSSELQISNNQSNKVNTRIRPRAETKVLPSLVEQVGINDESGESQVECDDSSNASESFYVDKHDSSSIHGFDSLKGTVPGDLNGESHSQSLQAEKGDPSGHDVVAQGSNEWVQGWSSDFSVDNDLAVACEDSNKLSGSLELAVSTIFELKLELNTLQNQADAISVETQKFAQLLVAEIASGQELAKEVSLLKLQCLKFKHDLEEYRNVEFNIKLTAKDSVQTDLEHVFQGTQLKWLKGLLLVEDRIRELQEKTFIGLHDTDFSFVNTELVMLLSVMKDLKATVESVPSVLPGEGQHLTEATSMRSLNREQLMLGNECNVNLYEPEDTLQYVSMTTLVPQHPGSKRATDVLEEKIFDLLRQLEEAKIERDNVVRKMDQMECYYETLVQELEENQKRNLGELQSLRNEHSTCLYAMSTSRAEVESIRHDMNEQILRFSEERCVLDSLNKDLERRALAAESALRRARLNYSIAVNQLQKDLDLLSFQVLSMFETNQNLIKDAFSEASQLSLPGYPDVVGNPKKTDAALMLPCQVASPGVKKQLLGGDVLSDDLKKFLCLQEDLYQKVEEELCEMRSGNLFLDVFSETLKQILLEANTDIWKMKEKLDELEQQLELSNKSRDLLLIRLQAATEDVLSLKEQNASCLTKCSGMLMENNALEARLESVSNENIMLMQKTTECEALIRDYRVYESQCQAAFTEKLELENSLKLEIQENCKLQKENSSLMEKLKILEAEYSELALSKENMQKFVRFFHEKLGGLLAAYGKESGELSLFNDNLCQDLEFKDLNSMIMQLEEAQHDTCERVLQLMDQKKDMENGRDTVFAEKLELENSLKLEIQENCNLQKENSSLNEKLKILEAGYSESALSKENMKKVVRFFHEKLGSLLAAYGKQFGELSSFNDNLCQDLEFKELNSMIMQLEEAQHDTCERVLQLMDQKKDLENGRDTAFAEKLELENSLKLEIQENCNLQKENSSLNEKLKILEAGYSESALSKENMKKVVRFFHEKLGSLLAAYGKQSSELLSFNDNLCQDLEFKELNSIIMQLEEAQHDTSERVLQLIDQKKDLENGRDTVFAEKLELENSLKLEIQENCNLQKENSSLNEKLKILEAGYSELALSKEKMEKVVRFFHEKLRSLLSAYGKQSGELLSFNDNLCQDLEFKDLNGMIMQLEAAQHDTCERVLQLMDQKKDVENERDTAILSLSIAKSEIHGMTQRFRHEIYAISAKLDMSSSLVEKLQLQLESVVNKFNNGLEVESQHAQQSEELLACFSTLELELQKIYSKDSDLAQEILSLGAMSEELGRSKLAISDLVQEKQDFMMSLENKAEESIKLVTELDSLKECLKCVYEELHVERCSRAKLEDTVAGLTYQLNDKHEKLLHFDSQNAELSQVRKLVSELESENSRVLYLLLQQEESLEKFQKEKYCFNDLSSELLEMQVHTVAADICITFLRIQYQTFFEELVQQLRLSDGHHEELEKKNLITEERLKHCLEEREKLLTTIESLGLEVNASIAQNVIELEQSKSRLSELELSLSGGKTRHAIEVGLLNNMLAKSEQEVDSLILSKEELEIIRVILEAKLNEHHVRLSSLEQDNDELMMLRNRCNELSYKLSEQILKTEEFKNLSTHLKELKDNADAECALAREKKESGGPSVAMQESLRMAFIKEQYETRLHELKQQLSVSKRHSEEMLFKLQDAIDETENRKKSEASHIRRNEELALKVVELEAELQSVISDKREIVKSYDRIQAELECALLSLECCKEEKGKLDASLKECEKVKSNIVAELSSVKLQLKTLSRTNSLKEGNGEAGRQMQLSGGLSIEMDRGNPLTADLSCATGSTEVYENFSTENSSSNKLVQNGLVYDDESRDVSSPTTGEGECLAASMSSQSIQVISDSGSVHGITEQAHEGDLLFKNSNQLTVARDNVGAHHLKSCMEHLDEELERMKNENSLISQTSYDASFQDLQRELLQLHQVNQELGSIYPLFNNFTGSGSALDRVLALEIELAEALREKNKSSMKFQSSFLKQHGDKEAVFKSFRDINELIKDMLEIKGKYVTVESELKEMHNRYSELSLQFAEVEGERQKLLMTLKNVRSSRKTLESNRSMPVDHPL